MKLLTALFASVISCTLSGCLTTGSIAYNDPTTGITSMWSVSKDWADGKTTHPLKVSK